MIPPIAGFRPKRAVLASSRSKIWAAVPSSRRFPWMGRPIRSIRAAGFERFEASGQGYHCALAANRIVRSHFRRAGMEKYTKNALNPGPGPAHVHDPNVRDALKKAAVWLSMAGLFWIAWQLAQRSLMFPAGRVSAALTTGGGRCRERG